MGEGLLQPMHLLLIFGIALLVFGPKKLPELGKGLGEAILAEYDIPQLPADYHERARAAEYSPTASRPSRPKSATRPPSATARR